MVYIFGNVRRSKSLPDENASIFTEVVLELILNN